MLLKTILNLVEKHAGFVYERLVVVAAGSGNQIEVEVRSRRRSRPICSGCSRRGPRHDTLASRRFQYVPLWGIPVYFVYSMRRVSCRRCGVRVEVVPWAEGKRQTTRSFEWFRATWAKRLNWTEVAQIFGTAFDTVFRAVEREWNGDALTPTTLESKRFESTRSSGNSGKPTSPSCIRSTSASGG